MELKEGIAYVLLAGWVAVITKICLMGYGLPGAVVAIFFALVAKDKV